MVETKGNINLDQFHPTNEKCAVSCTTVSFTIELFIFTFVYVTEQLHKILKVNKSLQCHFSMLEKVALLKKLSEDFISGYS